MGLYVITDDDHNDDHRWITRKRKGEEDAALNWGRVKWALITALAISGVLTSQTTLAKTLVTPNAAGAAPSGFAWWDVNNSAVPITLAELNGLSSVIFDRAWVAFKRKQALKAQVRGAVTAAEVEGVAW